MQNFRVLLGLGTCTGLDGVSNCKTTDEMKIAVIRDCGHQHGGELGCGLPASPDIRPNDTLIFSRNPQGFTRNMIQTIGLARTDIIMIVVTQAICADYHRWAPFELTLVSSRIGESMCLQCLLR